MKQEEQYEKILKMEGNENAYLLHKELGEWMTDNVTIVRYNDRLKKTDEKIQELMERYQNIDMVDTSQLEQPGSALYAPFVEYVPIGTGDYIGSISSKREPWCCIINQNSLIATMKNG